MRRVLFLFCCVLGAIGLAGFLWSLIPPGEASLVENFPENLGSLYGKDQLVVTQPNFLRMGEGADLRLQIQPVSNAPDRNPLEEGRTVTFQSRLAIPGITILPEELTSTKFDPLHGAAFSWKLIPQRVGILEGTLRIYAIRDSQPKPGEVGELIFALPVTIDSRMVLGVPLDVFRTICLLLLFAGGLVGMLVYFTGSHAKKHPSRN